ncbi:hypothetical protein HFO97_16445 [Rhizobium leguminosarum]|uniref:hypothetical protein n=1 Tax=Rhizobium leguminosarum TaxID=384 RepID=UPI001C9378DA|nr:hypothetical protein [Rhizobium leguminosarum]MBY5361515.1 hypothetical protein [Rhizobium leguminosarum]
MTALELTGGFGTLHGLFAMGSLGLGSLPDIDLVPQIVVQSHAAASLLNSWIGDVAKSPHVVKACDDV